MNSICFFSSYFNESGIPYYVRFYLDQLAPFFSKIVFITNDKKLSDDSLSYLKEKNIAFMPVKNEGWDFGMWYKAFKVYDILSFDRIGLVNDSCILFKPPHHFFNWLEKSELDYCGMVDSNAISYHLQSYFLIINKKAIPDAYQYFMENCILANVKEVIHTYEIGLSRYLIHKGHRIGACYTTKEYKGEYSPTFFMTKTLIEKGFPLIKKKIIFSSFRKDEYLTLVRMKFRLDPRYYIHIVQQCGGVIDFKKIVQPSLFFYMKLLAYNTFYILYQVLRKFKRSKK